MSTGEIPQDLTPQQFLEWEEQQSERYEYFDGKIYHRTGITVAHNTVCLNLGCEINSYLRGKPGWVFMSAMKLQVTEDGPFFYPDVVVTCDERDEGRDILQYPCLVAEALWPNTEAFDRGDKFAQYRRIPTLQEYVLIDCGQQSVESFRRDNSSPNTWICHFYRPGSVVTFDSIGLRLPIDTIYEKVRFQ
ncbi:Uma2 family endonuclease [Gloeobacter kilaueensis]|uniref:Putative restriction endonuclease domain-containing protein n=1 Tax=Gloeobacter kilaueensis (strain ATCC BAA-2537 / CCAP 1431/1 / ULC 316 / JS1) TaxID=1183438 RepID=U5QLY9_GLOK1|nr:Uma2 family endonuclease [Gloeobacter kilaueensis]AGY58700.1 hypothetical protein GKIL_2454 [Gloeobacter kilaueensis JS1]